MAASVGHVPVTPLASSLELAVAAAAPTSPTGRRDPDGAIEILAVDPRLIWPDTFWITPDRWLYVSSSQVNRRGGYSGGTDNARAPYAVLRMRIDAGPA